ncbi:MAG: glycosyltransferase family 39 protein [Bacteroidota bacterium]|nr:glycosyltransferase family 39 protein [Bacteroidota bacterium]
MCAPPRPRRLDRHARGNATVAAMQGHTGGEEVMGRTGWLERPRTIWAILLVALSIRSGALILVDGLSLRNDQRNYHDVAVLIARGVPYAPHWPPGLPYYLAAWYLLFGPAETTGRLAMLVLSIPFTLLVYHLGRVCAGRRAGSLLALCFACYPTFVFHSVEPLTQMPAAVALLGLAAAVSSARPWRLGDIVSGAAASAAVLVRPSAILLVPFAAVARSLRTRRLGSAGLALATAAVLIGAWTVKAFELAGGPVLINFNNSRNFFYGNNPYTPLYRTWWLGSHTSGEEGVPPVYTERIMSIDRLPFRARDSVFLDAAVTHILERPDLFALRTLNRVRAFFAYDVFAGAFLYKFYGFPRAVGLGVIALDALFYAVFCISAAFALVAAKDRISFGLRVALWILVLYAIPYAVSFSHPTYHFAVVPMIGLLAAPLLAAPLRGRDGLPARWRGLTRVRKIAFAVFLLVFLFIQLEWTWVMFPRI